MQRGFHNRFFFLIIAQVPFPPSRNCQIHPKKSVTEVFKQLLSRAGRQADKGKAQRKDGALSQAPTNAKTSLGARWLKGYHRSGGKKKNNPTPQPPALADVLAGGSSGFPWAGRVLLELRHKSRGLMQV